MDYATRVGDIIADKRTYRPTEQETTDYKTVVEVRPNGPNSEDDETEVILGDGIGYDAAREREDYEAMPMSELQEKAAAGDLSVVHYIEPSDEDDTNTAGRVTA